MHVVAAIFANHDRNRGLELNGMDSIEAVAVVGRLVVRFVTAALNTWGWYLRLFLSCSFGVDRREIGAFMSSGFFGRYDGGFDWNMV